VNWGSLRLRVGALPTSTPARRARICPVRAFAKTSTNLRSDDLRRETVQVQMDLHLERIETRLNLHDAE
jgi:hypothetical protein